MYALKSGGWRPLITGQLAVRERTTAGMREPSDGGVAERRVARDCGDARIRAADEGGGAGRWVADEGGAGMRAASELSDPEDELFLLGERCAETYMRADALHYEAMVLLAEYDERGGWQDTGFGSTAEWLAWRVGLTLGPARERVRTARALRSLPETSAALRAGELSFTKVRALTRVARPESEAALLELARSCSAAKLERLVRGWATLTRAGEAQAEERRHRGRTFSVFADEDGMYAVRGRLEAEVGAALMRAVEAASDALYRGDDVGDSTPEQRRADAVGLIAERALAAGFTDGAVSGSRAQRYQVVLHVEEATLAGAGEREDRGTRVSAETSGGPPEPGRRELDDGLRVSAETSREGEMRVSAETSQEGEMRVSAETSRGAETSQGAETSRVAAPGQTGVDRGRSELADGTRVSAETSRRIACDCSLVRITHAWDGSILDVGRKTRTVLPTLRRALEARDRGCRFPGCGSRFTDAHHIEHWAEGGETSLANLVLLCRRHHRFVHEGGARVCRGADGSVGFFTRNGRALYDAPPRRGGPDGVRASFGRGGSPDRGSGAVRPNSESRLPLPWHRSGAARWARDLDVPWYIEARARDALEAAAE
ncbi:MAG TPA: DUF222 domain-containing protein [Longimicrobiales bacterium]|nr:DUF222 domain-containing protein [Longimicrobiales bacterium]